MSQHLEHIRELKTRWQIRFTDNRRSPKEQTYSFRKALYSRQAIKRERDRLYAAWGDGWDPWSSLLPGQTADRTLVSLSSAISRYCAYKEDLGRRGLQGGWNANTTADYRVRLGAFASLVGLHRAVTELTTADLERYIFAPGIADATQRTRRRLLKTFVGHLRRERLVYELEVPVPFVERVRRPQVFTERDVEAIVEAHRLINQERPQKKHAPKNGTDNLWLCDFIWLGFFQGLRRSENLALKASVVDLAGRRLYVGHKDFIPKGRHESVITITQPALPVLERLLRGKARSDYLYPRVTARHVSRLFKRALRRAVELHWVDVEKEPMHLHDLRDSCLEYWLNEKGIRIVRCQELLRHKDIKTTMNHYKSTNVEAQTREFDAAFQRTAGP